MFVDQTSFLIPLRVCFFSWGYLVDVNGPSSSILHLPTHLLKVVANWKDVIFLYKTLCTVFILEIMKTLKNLDSLSHSMSSLLSLDVSFCTFWERRHVDVLTTVNFFLREDSTQRFHEIKKNIWTTTEIWVVFGIVTVTGVRIKRADEGGQDSINWKLVPFLGTGMCMKKCMKQSS